jgi:hypothetical protein
MMKNQHDGGEDPDAGFKHPAPGPGQGQHSGNATHQGERQQIALGAFEAEPEKQAALQHK